MYFAHSWSWLLLSFLPLSITMALGAPYRDTRFCQRNLILFWVVIAVRGLTLIHWATTHNRYCPRVSGIGSPVPRGWMLLGTFLSLPHRRVTSIPVNWVGNYGISIRGRGHPFSLWVNSSQAWGIFVPKTVRWGGHYIFQRALLGVLGCRLCWGITRMVWNILVYRACCLWQRVGFPCSLSSSASSVFRQFYRFRGIAALGSVSHVHFFPWWHEWN